MKANVIDTKLIWNKEGLIYHITRTRRGIFDTVAISYPMESGIKTITGTIFSGFGWLAQKGIEIAADFI